MEQTKHKQVSEEAGISIFKDYFSTFIKGLLLFEIPTLESNPEKKYVFLWKGTSIYDQQEYSLATFEVQGNNLMCYDTKENPNLNKQIFDKVSKDTTPFRIFIQPRFDDFSLFFVVDLQVYFSILRDPRSVEDNKETWAEGITHMIREVQNGNKIEEYFALGYWEKACKLPTNDFYDVKPNFFDADNYAPKWSEQVYKLAVENNFYENEIKDLLANENLQGVVSLKLKTNIVTGFCLYTYTTYNSTQTVELQYQLIGKEDRGKGVGGALLQRMLDVLKYRFGSKKIRILVEPKQNEKTKEFWKSNSFPLNKVGLGEKLMEPFLEEEVAMPGVAIEMMDDAEIDAI